MACETIEDARKFLEEVKSLAKKYNANFFIVTDGASAIQNKGNDAVKRAREAHIKWEIENGFDPNEDWGNKSKSKENSIIIEISEKE